MSPFNLRCHKCHLTVDACRCVDFGICMTRLNIVKRLSDEEIARRQKDLEENGEVFCYNCDPPSQHKKVIDVGVFEFNPQTKLFDIHATSGRIVQQCPKCGYIDKYQHDIPHKGICHEGGWYTKQGEWREHICNSDQCLDKGKPYIELCCPGCAQLVFWHTATNGPKNAHGWTVNIQDGRLTMSPSLLELTGGKCHFFIKDNQVQWC